MKAVLACCGLAVVLCAGECRAAETKLPLRVLFVGNERSERTAEFVVFLKSRFADVGEKKRDGLDPIAARAFDVVVLDWSQQDTDSEKAVSPFGAREQWSKPTVLLGSAGHLLASPWQIIGGAG